MTSKKIPNKLIADFLGLSRRTIQRWQKNPAGDKRKGAKRNVKFSLTEEEIQRILDVANSPEYRSLAPAEIVAILAEKGEYIASERSFYRVLKRENQLTFRGPGKKPTQRIRASHEVDGPLQLLSWDITYIKTNIKGMYYYLYLFMDVWSRKILGWDLHEEESSKISAEIIDRIASENQINKAILHSDNGSPMKGSTMLMKLYDLGVTTSFSRPRVSEDNPYSESLFKTLKYRPSYPGRFDSIASAKEWVANFVNWYNYEHRHSGIGYVTPHQRHTGADKGIFKQRNLTYENAKNSCPQRWSGSRKEWSYTEKVRLGGSKAA